jgi:methylthioribose-1-phosphate isomerase
VNHILFEKDTLFLLDQRLLPWEEKYVECKTAEDVAWAIKEMVIRGAPAIGIVAALGVVLQAKRNPSRPKEEALRAIELLKNTRPTARNLFWALERMEKVALSGEPDLVLSLEREALNIWEEDLQINMAIAQNGAKLLGPSNRVLTHCNAGGLATGGYGTALGVIKRAFEEGKILQVYVTETRPWLQGARLTSWELKREGIPVTVVVDSAAGYLMSRGLVDALIVGADRVTSRGDVVNKIGTYTLAVLAHRHGIPFYVAAPLSTFDMDLLKGEEVLIEERDEKEVLEIYGKRVAPEGVTALNPSFDITPAELIKAIITEKGVLWPPL